MNKQMRFTAWAFVLACLLSPFPLEGAETAGDFCCNTIGPEILLPLDERGFIRLRWQPYKRQSRFEFKAFEKPVYRIFIAPEGVPAIQGRIHVTYDSSYPFTNLAAGKGYNIMVDVEQNSRIVLPEKLYKAEAIAPKVKWYVAPRASGGNPGNPGTYNQPVDVGTAAGRAGPGDIVVLKSGAYISRADGKDENNHDRTVHPANSGAPGAHILFLAESNDISKKGYVSFRTAWGNISVNKTDYVVFDGLNCDSDQGRNSKALTSVLGEYGHRPMGVIVRNIFFRSPTGDKQIMVNAAREVLIENCFFPGSAESHNAYLCNNTRNRPEYSDSRIILRNSIAMNATRNNVHANGYFDNFIIENNLFIGSKVANISLATVHRNSLIRNNIAYSGAKQAVTLNFYQESGGVPLEDKTPCSNIQICHNTLVVPETVQYSFANIVISDSRHLPNKHAIRGLFIKNNILANLKKAGDCTILNFYQARHLAHTEVAGNVYLNSGTDGDIRVPEKGRREGVLKPFAYFEEHSKTGDILEFMDMFRDGKGTDLYETMKLKLCRWAKNRPVKELGRLFVNAGCRDYRLAKNSPAMGAGVSDGHTRRIIRDIYGNMRTHGEGQVHTGAIVAGSSREATIRLSEYRLNWGRPVAGSIESGQRTLVASAILMVRSPASTVLRDVIIDFVLQKRDKNKVVDIKTGFVAEIEVNGVKKGLTFYKSDQAGYENVWVSGHAPSLGIHVKPGEKIELLVYLTLGKAEAAILHKVGTTVAFDNIWGFDATGRKLAVTVHNELNFGQSVPGN